MGGFGTPTRLPEGSDEGREEGKVVDELVLGTAEGADGTSEGVGTSDGVGPAVGVEGVLVGWAVEWSARLPVFEKRRVQS
jgi:hypothetical protein